jgi:uncharacterized coiled-coil protein SlyX
MISPELVDLEATVAVQAATIAELRAVNAVQAQAIAALEARVAALERPLGTPTPPTPPTAVLGWPAKVPGSAPVQRAVVSCRLP